jgi:DNA-binding transcriptional MerR regulator
VMVLASQQPNIPPADPSVRHGRTSLAREFSTSQVVGLTGLSARQLGWWEEKNIVRPLHREEGDRRVYDLTGVTLLMIAGRIREHANLTRIQKLCRALRKDLRFTEAIESRGSGFCYLLVSTKHARIHWNLEESAASASVIWDMRNYSGAFLLIDICEFVRRACRERIQ